MLPVPEDDHMSRALLAALTHALATPRQEAPAPTFHCQVVPSADLAGVDRWYGADVPNFEIAGTERVVRGQRFLVYVFFGGVVRDESDEVEVTLDLRILRPDSSVYHEAEDLKALRGRVTGDFLLMDDLTGVFFEPQDALGAYRIEVEARDEVGASSARAEAMVELVQYEEGEPFAGADEISSWAWNYFHDPDPCRAAPALRAYARHGVEELTPVHGALAELLELNAWLLPILFAEFEDGESEVRTLLLWLLSRTTHDPAPFVAELAEDERAQWRRFREVPNPVEDPLAGRKDVNELLGRYLLGRGSEQLLRLVLALDPEANEVVADTTVHDSTHDVDVPLPRVMSRFVGQQLAECLGDPWTRGYLEVMARDEDVPEAVRERLEELLAEEDEDKGSK